MPKGRILAVDDQRYFRELLEGLLCEEGYDVVTASSGEEALRILDQSDFDVVLTDLVMPGMDGNDLVHRVKERDPEQEIIVVTGVVDVKTAVDAMKLGAAEYLIKPFDRETLAGAIEKILQNRRLRTEHARLLAENIEYMGERTLYERAVALFSCLAVDPLAARIVEGMCVETRAQGGIVWVVDEDDPDRLNLAAVRGLVRVNEEPDVVMLEQVPEELADGSRVSLLLPWSEDGGEERPAMFLAMRREGRVIGLVRLTDKLGHDEFDAVDQAFAEKFAQYGETALVNALRFARLEQNSLADPSTGAYVFDYFHDIVRSEIEKSNRFGRNFSLLEVELAELEPLQERLGERGGQEWLAGIVKRLRSAMRSADILAADGDGRFLVLLPETDTLGGAIFKQRVAQELECDPLLTDLAGDHCPKVHFAITNYPADGTQLESILRTLEERLTADRVSLVRELELETRPLADSLSALAGHGEIERPEVIESIADFVMAEVARRPEERGLLFVCPGKHLADTTRNGLAAFESESPRSEVVVISDQAAPASLNGGVTWLSAPAGDSLPPFLVRYTDGAVYALICDEKPNDAGVRMFHTDDRSVVEFLAFRLQRELALPELA
jgi:two-component system cell cycle response regulator